MSAISHIYDEHETLGVLRFVVAEKGPEYVYKRFPIGQGYACYYWNHEAGCPSCLVGHVLAQLGFTNPPAFIEGKSVEMAVDEHMANAARNAEAVAWWRERFTLNALRLLAVAQEAQDGLKTWGVALERAEAEYRILHPLLGG